MTYKIKEACHIHHFNVTAHEYTIAGPAIDGKYPITIIEPLMMLNRTLEGIVYTSEKHPTKRSTNNGAYIIIALEKCYRIDDHRVDCTRF
jgi:hypothetical protein